MYWSKSNMLSSDRSKYKYFSVSANQKLDIESVLTVGTCTGSRTSMAGVGKASPNTSQQMVTAAGG